MPKIEIHIEPKNIPRRDADGMIVHGPAPTISGFFAAVILVVAAMAAGGWVLNKTWPGDRMAIIGTPKDFKKWNEAALKREESLGDWIVRVANEAAARA